MNGDTLSIKAPKECPKKFAAALQGKFLTRGNVLRILLLHLPSPNRGVPYRKGALTEVNSSGLIFGARLDGGQVLPTPPPPRTRMKWVPFVLSAFFPLFYSIFCFKSGHFPFKT